MKKFRDMILDMKLLQVDELNSGTRFGVFAIIYNKL